MAQPTVGAAAAITGVGTFLASATAIRQAVLGMNLALHASGAAGAVAGTGLTTAAAGAAAAAVPMALLVGAVTLGVGALVGLTAAIVGVGTSMAIAGVKIASDFQTNIGRVGAITSSTTEELHKLRAQVVELSLATGKSLGDISEAAFELAKGGIEITQQLGPTGALKAVTDLTIASSGELGLAQSAQAVARGIKAFGLEAGEANIVADALTNAAQRSTSGFSDLTNAFSYLASTASTMGMTIAETAAVVGVLSDANILGSQAGTNFRQSLISLIDPSKEGAKVMQQYGISIKDAEGNIRPFRDILGDLEGAFSDTAIASGKLTEAEQLRALNMIFTTRGMNAMLALINQGVVAFDRLSEVTLTAADVAERMLLPLSAQFGILTNAIKVAANAFGEGFIPMLSEATRGAIQFLSDGGRLRNILTGISLAISGIIAGRGLGEVFQLWGRAGLEAGSSIERAIRSVIDIMLTIRNVVTQGIIPALQELAGVVTGIKPGDDVAAGWASLGEAIANIILVAGKVATAVIGYVALVIESFKAWVEAGNVLVEAVIGYVAAIVKTYQIMGSAIIDVVVAVVEAMGAIGEALDTLTGVTGTAIALMSPMWFALFQIVQTTVRYIIPLIADLADAVAELVPAIASAVQGWTANLNGLAQVTGIVLGAVVRAIGNALSAIAGALAAVDSETPILGGIVSGFRAAGAAASAFGSSVATVAPNVTTSVERLGGRIRALGEATGAVGDTWSALGASINTGVGNSLARFGEIIARAQRLKDIIGSIELGDSFSLSGRGFNLDNLIQGMNRLQDATGGAREEAERSAPAFDDLSDAAKDAAKAAEKLADAFDEVALEIAKLEQDFAELERNAADKIEEIGLKFAERMVEANVEWAESTQEATQKASDAIDELNQNLADNRAMRERRDNFESELQQEADAWRTHWENIEFEEKLVMDRMNRARQRMLDDIQDRLDKANDEAARKRDRLLEDERQKRGDVLEDERDRRGKEQQAELDALKAKQKAAEDLLKDKQKAELDALKATSEETDKAAEDRLKEQQENELNNLKLGQELAFNKAKDDIDNAEKLRRRAEEREERDRRRSEEEAERSLREQMADGERKRNRALEDEEAKINEARDRASLALSRNMEEIEREFKARQDTRRRTEEDKIEDERVTKRINEINSEKDKRIQEINLVLKKKQEKITEDADEEVRKYKKALDERMADLRDALLDKSIKLVQEHGEAIQPAIDELFYVFDTRAERTISLYQQLVSTLDQVLRMQAQVSTPESIQSRGMRNVPMSIGSVPMGPVGYGNNLSTVNYNVNASYQNAQSPATIREDMQALVMLSMR